MARPKKGEEKPKESANLMVSIEDFIRTRDSVRLSNLMLWSRLAFTVDAIINIAHHRLKLKPSFSRVNVLVPLLSHSSNV